MTTKDKKRAAKDQAVEAIRARGAELLKTEDRFGETRTGWWIDGVWLAPANDPAHALRIMNGAG